MYYSKKDFFMSEKVVISGKADEPNTCLFKDVDSGIIYRRVYIDSITGGEEADVMQITDTHLNHINIKDFEEKNPSVLSTLEYRRGFRGESTFDNLEKIMKLAPLFDKLIVTGDVIDYLTWGALELTEKYIYDQCPDALLAVGGHDITRVMQGRVADSDSLKSRYDVLKTIWRNDLYYHSEVLADKAMLVVLNNGEGKYYGFQIEKLKNDIQKAKKQNLVILLFQHEPLCTKNPKETDVTPLWEGDADAGRNFYEDYLGKEDDGSDTAKMYRLITENADVIRGIFCGHAHNEFYTEIVASYVQDGIVKQTIIPQHVLQGVPYEEGHMLIITIRGEMKRNDIS